MLAAPSGSATGERGAQPSSRSNAKAAIMGSRGSKRALAMVCGAGWNPATEPKKRPGSSHAEAMQHNARCAGPAVQFDAKGASKTAASGHEGPNVPLAPPARRPLAPPPNRPCSSATLVAAEAALVAAKATVAVAANLRVAGARGADSPQSGGRSPPPDQAAEQAVIAAEADDRDGLGRVPPGGAPAKEPAEAGAIGEAAVLAPAADAPAGILPAACVQRGGAAASGAAAERGSGERTAAPEAAAEGEAAGAEAEASAGSTVASDTDYSYLRSSAKARAAAAAEAEPEAAEPGPAAEPVAASAPAGAEGARAEAPAEAPAAPPSLSSDASPAAAAADATSGLSQYERERLRNIEKNGEKLVELGLQESAEQREAERQRAAESQRQRREARALQEAARHAEREAHRREGSKRLAAQEEERRTCLTGLPRAECSSAVLQMFTPGPLSRAGNVLTVPYPQKCSDSVLTAF